MGVGVIFKAMGVSMALKKKKSVSRKTHREILLQNLNLREETAGEMIIQWQPNHKAA